MVRTNSVSNPHAVLSVLSDIERRSQQPSMAGKRQFIRKSLRGEAMLQTLEDASVDGASLRVQLRDISMAGLGFLVSEPVAVGSLWRVHFLSRNYAVGQQTIIVRHCRAIMDGAYLVGGQFAMDPGMLQTIGIDPQSLRENDVDDFVGSDNICPL